MVISALAFYLFASILTLSSLMVITARNPVHAVLFLILAFFNAAGLFVLLGAEFIAMIMVIVYVGAVAVLFLFVVMMLDMNFADLRKGSMQYVSIGMVIGGILLAELFVLFKAWDAVPIAEMDLAADAERFKDVTNTEALGQLLYTEYVYAFQIAGLILFVAMVGAIVLTLRKRPGVRKQSVADQQARKPSDVLKVHKITPRTGA